jgi:hypothetical protein
MDTNRDKAKESVRQGAEQVTDEARRRAESMKAQAGEQAERTAHALDSAADELAAEGQESLAHAVSSFSKQLGDLASQLEHKSIDDLVHDAGRLASRNPLLFVAGSVAAGMLLSRFFKARQPTSSARGMGAGTWEQDLDRRDYDYEYDDRYDPALLDPATAEAMNAAQQAQPAAGQPDPRTAGTPLRAGESRTDESSSKTKRGA